MALLFENFQMHRLDYFSWEWNGFYVEKVDTANEINILLDELKESLITKIKTKKLLMFNLFYP